jgi:hypothetical protein
VAVAISELRKLLQRSGNVCAYPGFTVMLTSAGTGSDPIVVVSEVAHIVAESPDGPRGDSLLSEPERNRYENLILLPVSLRDDRHRGPHLGEVIGALHRRLDIAEEFRGLAAPTRSRGDRSEHHHRPVGRVGSPSPRLLFIQNHTIYA